MPGFLRNVRNGLRSEGVWLTASQMAILRNLMGPPRTAKERELLRRVDERLAVMALHRKRPSA